MIGLPPHIARPTTSLVGPIVLFRGQDIAVTSSPPRSTCDPRYDRCTDHHLACDCREAETAEQLDEYRSELSKVRDVLQVMIAGHPTEVFIGYARREELECRCKLCHFARTVRMIPWRNRRHLTHPDGRY